MATKKKTTVSQSKPPSISSAAASEPLITISNPLRFIFLWLEDIKNWIKKDSDGEIRIHIPFKWFVTALLIFLAGGAIPAYWQGKAVEYAGWIAKPTPTPVIVIQPTLTPAPVLVTRLGIIKATYQVRNLIASPTIEVSSHSAKLGTGDSGSGTEAPLPIRFVLMTDTYKLIFLKVPTDVTLQKYIGYKALVTGLYTAASNTISINDLDDIEVVY